MKITLEHPDPHILDHFQQVVGWLNLEEKLDEVQEEYFRTGRAFAQLDILCDICNDFATSACHHPGGTVGRILVLNSDWVTNLGSGHAIIAHEELLQRVQENDPTIPSQVRDHITNNGLIPLSNRTLVVINSLFDSELVAERVFQIIAEMQGFIRCGFRCDFF